MLSLSVFTYTWLLPSPRVRPATTTRTLLRAPTRRSGLAVTLVVRQAIWLYLRFTLSFRDVEDLLAERGIMVSYETVRRWVIWHLDEVYLKIDGRMVYLWPAVHSEGEILVAEHLARGGNLLIKFQRQCSDQVIVAAARQSNQAAMMAIAAAICHTRRGPR